MAASVPTARTPSPSHASDSEQEDAELKLSIDALLDAEQAGSSSSTPRSPSSNLSAQGHATLTKVIAFASLLVYSVLASWILPHAALQNRSAVLMLVPVEFLSLGIIALAVGRFNVVKKLRLGKSGQAQGGTGMTVVVGGLSVASYLVGIWKARLLDGKVWQALEASTRDQSVFIIPVLILLPPFLGRFVYCPPRVLNPLFSIYVAIAASIGLSMIGVPASGSGLFCAMLRIPIESVRWFLLKEGMAGDRGGAFLEGSASAAFLWSVVVLVISPIFSIDSAWVPLTRSDFHTLISYALISLLSQVSLIACLHIFTSPLSVAAVILPRNIVLLIGNAVARHGLAIRGNWAQMLLVLSVGVFAIARNDAEFIGMVLSGTQSLQSRLGRRPSYQRHVTHPSDAPASSPANRSPTTKTSSRDRTPIPNYNLAFIPFIALIFYLAQSPSTTTSLASACSYLPTNVQTTLCRSVSDVPHSKTVDLVFAYHNEPLEGFRDHLARLREGDFVKQRTNKVYVYNKGPRAERELRSTLGLRKGDEVIPLENVGREGATYLRHILLHYNSSIEALASALSPFTPSRAALQPRVLADHTFFMQPHLAWHWIAQPRISLVGPNTGFQHFGPMMVNTCGNDSRVGGMYPLAVELFNIFAGELCPQEGFLTAWSGQFVTSKRRILAHPYARYAGVEALLTAPLGHWIHKNWGPNGSGSPSNPALGHSVERAWPLIMGCADVGMVEECPDDVHVREKCGCFDY